MALMDSTVTFPAVVQKVQTLADGGLRVTFDLPEAAILAAAELMAVRQAGCTVDVTVVPNMKNKQDHNSESEGKSKLEAWPKRKSKWAPSEE